MAEFVEGRTDADLVDPFRTASEEVPAACVKAVGRVGSPVGHRDARRIRAQLREVAGRALLNVTGSCKAERALAPAASFKFVDPHDIDCNVEPARREEARCVRVLVRGICLARESDPEYLEAAYAAFDGIRAHFAES